MKRANIAPPAQVAIKGILHPAAQSHVKRGEWLFETEKARFHGEVATQTASFWAGSSVILLLIQTGATSALDTTGLVPRLLGAGGVPLSCDSADRVVIEVQGNRLEMRVRRAALAVEIGATSDNMLYFLCVVVV